MQDGSEEEHDMVKGIETVPKTTYEKGHHALISPWLPAWRTKSCMNIVFAPHMYLMVPVAKCLDRRSEGFAFHPVDANYLVPMLSLLAVL